jgi:chemotaxis protein MotB
MRDAARFARAEIAIRLALQDAPDLARLIVTERNAEGLRIRIAGQNRALFPRGRADPSPDAQRLLAAISPAVAALPNPISICGHSEGPGDWSLSSARADAARKLLQANGVPGARFYEIAARAAGDGGVAITLLREEAP